MIELSLAEVAKATRGALHDADPTTRVTHGVEYDSRRIEPGGLFLGVVIPDVATTDTNVPGQVAALALRTVIGSQSMNTATNEGTHPIPTIGLPAHLGRTTSTS